MGVVMGLLVAAEPQMTLWLPPDAFDDFPLLELPVIAGSAFDVPAARQSTVTYKIAPGTLTTSSTAASVVHALCGMYLVEFVPY